MVRKKEVREGLRERMQKKIVHAKQRGHISEREIYTLTKEFFRELLKLEYEFTHEELIDELKKTYLEKRDFEQAKSFIEKIGVLEFTSSEYTQEQLKTMVREFEDIVLRLAQDEKKESWFEKLQKKLFTSKKKEKEVEEKTPELENLIHQIKNAKSNKQELYHKAISAYEALAEDKKAMYYTDLLGIYYDLKKVKKTETTKEEMKEFEEGLHLEEKEVVQPDKNSEKLLDSIERAPAPEESVEEQNNDLNETVQTEASNNEDVQKTEDFSSETLEKETNSNSDNLDELIDESNKEQTVQEEINEALEKETKSSKKNSAKKETVEDEEHIAIVDVK